MPVRYSFNDGGNRGFIVSFLLELGPGLEPGTCCLQNSCSAIELSQLEQETESLRSRVAKIIAHPPVEISTFGMARLPLS
jgi:hypothetical protein